MRKTLSKAPAVVPQALDSPRLSLNDLARGIGASPDALRKYRQSSAGGRVMPERYRLRLAAFLEEHAKGLLHLAEALREVNGGRSNGS